MPHLSTRQRVGSAPMWAHVMYQGGPFNIRTVAIDVARSQGIAQDCTISP